MTFQFCCPQGHLLQGELSMVGQLLQCPMCGANFIVPPPQGAAPQFPTPFAAPPTVLPAGPTEQAVAPQSAASGQTQPENEEGPRFNLGFDPYAKATLPFELAGSGDAESGGPAASPSGTSLPAGPYAAGPMPAAMLQPFSPAGEPPAAEGFDPHSEENAASSAPEEDFLPETPAQPANDRKLPKILHFRCPEGHLVKGSRNLLGKNGRCPACKKTFELRLENSVEFQRRTEKILQREENKNVRAGVAWALLIAFLVFAALTGVVLLTR